ncbi:MAG: 3-hydroxyacyl-CoA dehydrogenase family protein [Promethearchaeota archaeon]
MTKPEQIAVIGAGLMGHGIAQVFAVKGHPVRIVDSNKNSLNSVKDRVRGNLNSMIDQGLDFDLTIEDILDCITLSDDLISACKDSDFVIEAVFENLKLKQEIFKKLDDLCSKNTILCTNTSVISITDIARNIKHRERILGTHFWNPPYLIPLVEVVRGEMTADWCASVTYELLKRVGKYPVYVLKDVPGFIGNRMQHALWREAFAIIDEGICSPEAIDDVIRNGFGLRLPILGPIENADMVGLDLTLNIHDYILKYLNADPTPSTTLQTKVTEGNLGFKSGIGFLEWSESSIVESRERLMKYLINVLIEQQKQLK